MKTVLAGSLGDAVRPQMGVIFVDGYYQMGLKYFSRDKDKLARAFQHMFDLSLYYLALNNDGTVLGMAACTDGHTPSVKMDPAELRKHLGSFSGNLAYRFLRGIFEGTDSPVTFTDGMSNIEFVSTSAKHRHKGIATQIISDIFSMTPYEEYILDVADNNIPAVKTYEKLGFQTFMEIRQKWIFVKLWGINAMIYMKYVKNNTGDHSAG